MDGLLTGILTAGRIGSDQYCFWAISSSGSRIPIVWPAGFHARAHPLEVLNARGQVFARAGEKFGAAGGTGPAKAHNNCMFGQAVASYINSESPISH